jgi:hypothetical protein
LASSSLESAEWYVVELILSPDQKKPLCLSDRPLDFGTTEKDRPRGFVKDRF